jgi:Predicted membrane protein (DUF2339)
MVDRREGDMFEEARLALLERRTEILAERVEQLEDRLERAEAADGPHAPEPEWPAPERPRGRSGAAPRTTTDGAAHPPAPAAAEASGAARPPRTTRGASDAAAPAGSAPPPRARLAARRDPLEDLVAGRVLAWAGGSTVFVGLVLLFAVAISRGWIDEATRTLLGAVVSAALVGAGAWLRERLGRIDAASAAAAAGIGGMFACSVVATRAYDLVPVAAGLTLALATGAAAVALALRWDSHGMAALGVVGGLASPVLVGATPGGETIAILFAATLAAAAICVWRGWDWLALASFGVVTPQWLAGLADVDQTATLGALATLIGFGALFAAAAVGHDLRTRTTAARVRPLAVLALNAFVLAGPGWAIVDEHAGRDAANVWLAVLAAAHLVAGVALVRARRASLGVVVTILSAGVLAADAALVQALDGLALVLVWSTAAAGFAALSRAVGEGGSEPTPHAPRVVGEAGSEPAPQAARVREAGSEPAPQAAREVGEGATDSAPPVARRGGRIVDAALAVAVGGHLSLAALHTLLFEARPEVVAAGEGSTTGAAAVAAVVAASSVAAALLHRRPAWRDPLQAAGLAALAYLAAVVLDGAPLVAALAAGAALLAEVALRAPARPGDPRPLPLRAAVGGAALLAAALGHALALEAPPRTLVDGVDDLAAAALALGACSLAAWRIARAAASPVVRGAAPAASSGAASSATRRAPSRAARREASPAGSPDASPAGRPEASPARPAAAWPLPAAGAVPLYLASIAVVTLAGADDDAQMLLSALWGAVGVVALIVGLIRDLPAQRTGALTLVAAALAKVFLYDLATLDALARVASFLALGGLLLAGAFAWQRIRPPDERNRSAAPPAARG